MCQNRPENLLQCLSLSQLELVATARDWSTVNEFIQEQIRQILVRYGCVKASAAEPIIIKYSYHLPNFHENFTNFLVA